MFLKLIIGTVIGAIFGGILGYIGQCSGGS